MRFSKRHVKALAHAVSRMLSVYGPVDFDSEAFRKGCLQ